MKKILLLLFVTNVLTICVAQGQRPDRNVRPHNRRGHRNQTIRIDQRPTASRVSYLPIPDTEAINAINTFYDKIDSLGSLARRALGIDPKFVKGKAYFEEYSYQDFEKFCNTSKHHSLAFYPAFDGNQFKLLIRLVDIYGEPQGDYFQKIDTTSAKNQIQEFKKITLQDDSLIAKILLPDDFYTKKNLYYSARIDKESLLFWMKNNNLSNIQFYPSVHQEPDNNRYISIISRGLDSSNTAFIVRINNTDYSYFNVAYPCPPPRDCK